MRGRAALAAALLAGCGALCGTAACGAAACAAAVFAAPAAAVSSAPASPEPLDQLMRLLAARRHGRIAFTEEQTLAVLERPLESSGELLYDAPDRLEQRIVSPRPETVTVEHGMVTDRRGRHTRTLELGAYPQLSALIESLRATLGGDRAGLERAFAVRFAGDLADWTLTLTPRDAAAARIVREVRIAGSRAALRSVEILQVDGDRALLTLGPELEP